MKRSAMKSRRKTLKNYYRILGVKPAASPEDIKSAYRARVRSTHPDLEGGNGTTEEFKRVKEAYEVLSDPQTRAVYDLKMGYRKPTEQDPMAVENLEDFFDRLMEILKMDWWDDWVEDDA